MKGVSHGVMIDMDSTGSDESPRRKHQKEVMWRIIHEELTERQRQTFLAYYYQGLNLSQIASLQGICISTASRNLSRAERRVQRITKYL